MKTWIATRREGSWTVFEERSHDAPPRELLRVVVPASATREDLIRFGEHLIAEAKRGAAGVS